MADITWANVTAFDAGLSVVSAGAQTSILAYVNDAHDVDAFDGEAGPQLMLVRIYLAAHLGRVNLQGAGASGPVTSESAGGLSRSYGQLAAATGWHTTKWGTLYAEMIARSPATVGFVA